MKLAFLTETQFEGKWSKEYVNARTEVCWQIALDADHYCINNYHKVKGYDGVFVIVPKGEFFLNAIGVQLIQKENWLSGFLKTNFSEVLKENNSKLYFIQEGSTTLYNDMTVEDQFYYYNHLQNFDVLFAHNYYDMRYYRGMFPSVKVNVIPSLMLTNLIEQVEWRPENKVMIGGNMSRFYGGFQSYLVSNEFRGCEKWTMSSHSTRPDEPSIPDLKHYPRMTWVDWMKELSRFKFAIHMMPIYAAGTFMLNCAYFGIPCIAPKYTDTQMTCYPDITVLSAEDIESARIIANRLYHDERYYKTISDQAKEISRNSCHVNVDKWRDLMFMILNN